MKKVFYCLFAILTISVGLNVAKADCQTECYELNNCYITNSEGIIIDAHSSCIRSCDDKCVASAPKTYSKIQCGDLDVPYVAAKVTSTIVFILQIITPIIIIILGSLDLMKAVMAQKEDEIKKGRQVFVKRLIAGVFVFLVFVIVKTVIGVVAPDDEKTDMWSCVDCFINDNCKAK